MSDMRTFPEGQISNFWLPCVLVILRLSLGIRYWSFEFSVVDGGLLTTRKTDIVGKQWVTTGLLKKVVPPEGQWFLQRDPRHP